MAEKHELPKPKKHEHRMEKRVPPKPMVPPRAPNRAHPSSPAPTRRGH
jgi:hypothetical protein